MGGTRQGRVAIAMVSVTMFGLLLCDNMVKAYTPKTYTVGDHVGWDVSIPVYQWPEGKKFYTGDILVFNYDPEQYNVIVVNETAYNSCTTNEDSKEYDSGHDKITLNYGSNFFIGNLVAEDCTAGLKMAVHASAPPPTK